MAKVADKKIINKGMLMALVKSDGYSYAYGRLTRASWGIEFAAHIPKSIQRDVFQYIAFGTEPGQFVKALMQNDLMRTFATADEYNVTNIWKYCSFLYNYAPAHAFGSNQAYDDWTRRGGMLYMNVKGG